VALAQRPGSPGVLANLGTALQIHSDLAGAVTASQKAIALKPDLVRAHVTLGVALHRQGNLAGAVAAFQKAMVLEPDYVWALLPLAKALEAQGDLPGAVAAYQKAIVLMPDNVQAHVDLGKALEEQGDPASAVAAYQKAIALKPDLVKALHLDRIPARCYIRLSQWDKAATEYGKTDLTGRPLDDDAFAYAGLFLIRGDSEGYNRFFQSMTHRARTWTHREAFILARSCAMARKSPVDPVRAVLWANQAIAAAPSPWYSHALGLAQYRAGQFDQALQSLTKANAKGWSNADLNWFGLALVHHQLGHSDEAQRCLDKGIQWLELVGPPGLTRMVTLQPQDWIEAQLLRREAEEMLKTKQSP
jgi:tetratricopeptide (TPR) repeat protein